MLKKYLVLGMLCLAPVTFAEEEKDDSYKIPPHAMMSMAASACPYPDAKVAACINMAADVDDEKAIALGLRIKASEDIHIKITSVHSGDEGAITVGVGVKLW